MLNAHKNPTTMHTMHSREDAHLHPLITFALMFLANNGALLIFLHMLFGQFTVLGVLAIILLLSSSVMLYRTS